MLGVKSPLCFTLARRMKALTDAPEFSDAPFYVDEKRKKVFIDFGNSLPIDENGAFDASTIDDLIVAVPLYENPWLDCSNTLLVLGQISYKSPNWYQNTAGIQVFPANRNFLPDEMKTIVNHPLVVAKVQHIKLKC